MAKVKSSATSNVAIETILPSDREWARGGLGFVPGRSSWPERVRAIVEYYGGLKEVVTVSGLKLGRIRSWQSRDSKPRDLLDVAAQLGVSAEYLDGGVPTIDTDFQIEHARLALAQRAFSPSGSTPQRREARKLAIEEARKAIEAAEVAARGKQFAASIPVLQSQSGLADRPDGPAILPMLTISLGEAGLSDIPSPLALYREWLVRQRLDPADLGVVEQRDGLYLVDTSPRARALADQCLYAVVEAEGLSICQWQRRADGGELVLLRPVGTDPRRNPADIVGRVVYELSPR